MLRTPQIHARKPFDSFEKKTSVTHCRCFITPSPCVLLTRKVAFYLGNTRKRSFYVNLSGTYGDSEYSFTSSGTATSYETFKLNSDETEELCLKAKDLGDSDWLSILEVRTSLFSCIWLSRVVIFLVSSCGPRNCACFSRFLPGIIFG